MVPLYRIELYSPSYKAGASPTMLQRKRLVLCVAISLATLKVLLRLSNLAAGLYQSYCMLSHDNTFVNTCHNINTNKIAITNASNTP